MTAAGHELHTPDTIHWSGVHLNLSYEVSYIQKGVCNDTAS